MAASLTAAALAALTQALVAACPGVIGTDGTAIWYAPGTTANCQTAAQAALAAFNPAAVPTSMVLSTSAFIGRFTAAEQAALWKAAQADASGVIGSTLVVIQSSPTVDISTPLITNWVNSLVTAGVLTVARSSVIMTPPPQKAGP